MKTEKHAIISFDANNGVKRRVVRKTWPGAKVERTAAQGDPTTSRVLVVIDGNEDLPKRNVIKLTETSRKWLDAGYRIVTEYTSLTAEHMVSRKTYMGDKASHPFRMTSLQTAAAEFLTERALLIIK